MRIVNEFLNPIYPSSSYFHFIEDIFKIGGVLVGGILLKGKDSLGEAVWRVKEGVNNISKGWVSTSHELYSKRFIVPRWFGVRHIDEKRTVIRVDSRKVGDTNFRVLDYPGVISKVSIQPLKY